jgi:hypothetical protein
MWACVPVLFATALTLHDLAIGLMGRQFEYKAEMELAQWFECSLKVIHLKAISENFLQHV